MSPDRRGAARRPGPRPVAGHVARKRFGQHFLADRSVLAAIASAIGPRAGDPLLEIGPGLGALTAVLFETLPRMAAVEIDRDLCARLQRRYGDDRLVLFEADALSFDPARALERLAPDSGSSHSLRIVGNLPYNISSPLLVHLIDARHIVRDQHFLLQKEVVERIVAAPGSSDFGRLSVLLQAFYEVELLFEVGPEAFDPPPRVDSAVLRMIVRERPLVDDPAPLQKVLSVAFAQRRKMIRSTLLPWLAERGIGAEGLPGDARAEDISLECYCDLARALSKQG